LSEVNVSNHPIQFLKLHSVLLFLQKLDENYQEALTIDTSGYAVAFTYEELLGNHIWIRNSDDLQLAMNELRNSLCIFAAV